MTKPPYDDAKYTQPDQVRMRLYTIDGDQMTFDQIKRHCPHVTEKMLRDRLFRGERKLARLSRPPDMRKSVDKPKSWR